MRAKCRFCGAEVLTVYSDHQVLLLDAQTVAYISPDRGVWNDQVYVPESGRLIRCRIVRPGRTKPDGYGHRMHFDICKGGKDGNR